MAEFGPFNLALLPVDVEADWERAPLERRAREILTNQGLPDWKLTETVRGLERIFDAEVANGKSPEDALAHLDAEIVRILSSKLHVGEAT